MWSSAKVWLAIAAPLVVNAQNFLPSGADGNFPACAASCALLQQAQTTCLSQTGQQASALAAENCFCQSATLQGLYSTPDAICVAECPQQQDRVNLRQWFTTFCSQVGAGQDPNAATTSTTIVTSTSTGNTATTATNTGVSSSNGGQQSSSKGSQSWIESHWKWILMIGILAIGFGGLAWLLIFLRNRHRRKVNDRRAQLGGFPNEREKAAGARAATPDLWGPHQHMHATKGWEYHENSASVIPGQRREKRERRHSQRRSHKPGSQARHATEEVTEPRAVSATRPQSNHRSRGDPDAIETQRDPSRSRTRRPRGGSKYDFERDVEGR